MCGFHISSYMIVSNASPLIHLTRIGKIGYLLALHNKIIIPEAVFSEVIEGGMLAGYADANYLKTLFIESKIEKRTIKKEDAALKAYLHSGEYEAIILAQELQAPLIIDERKGRRIVEEKGILYYSTAGLILELLEKRIIGFIDFRDNLAKLGSGGWISSDVLNFFLNEGEKIENKERT